eukprot:COSAG02_NODE_792_length_17157_cov_6.602122_13_plen_221_part_00
MVASCVGDRILAMQAATIYSRRLSTKNVLLNAVYAGATRCAAAHHAGSRGTTDRVARVSPVKPDCSVRSRHLLEVWRGGRSAGAAPIPPTHVILHIMRRLNVKTKQSGASSLSTAQHFAAAVRISVRPSKQYRHADANCSSASHKDMVHATHRHHEHKAGRHRIALCRPAACGDENQSNQRAGQHQHCPHLRSLSDRRRGRDLIIAARAPRARHALLHFF